MLNFAYVLSWLCLLLFFNSLCTMSEKPVAYPINWSIVSSEIPKPRNLESPHLGKCICDVTWGACDPNCCCDDDCTDIERLKFNTCLKERVGYPPLDFCKKDQEKNERPVRGEENISSRRPSGYEAICLVRVNSVTQELTPFFALPAENLKPPLIQINDWFRVENASTFVVDGPISQLKRVSIETSMPQYRHMGYFTTPISRQDGFCMTQGRHVRFMNPIDSTTCLLSGEEICMRFPTTLYENIVLTYPGYTPTSTFTSLNLVIFDDTSNEILATVSSGLNIPPLYQTTALNSVCKNAVVKIRTFFDYDSSSKGLSLSSVNMQLYLRDVPFKNVQTVHFQTKFFRTGTTIPPTYYSGTPGYFEGSVVRAGKLVQENAKSSVSELVAGFSVPSGGRMCSEKKYRKVAFFHDVRSSGCTVSLSEEELRNVCFAHGTGPMLRNILGIESQSSNLISHVARTNDAQTNDTTSWVKIEGLDFQDIVPSYDAIQRRCSNIFVGLHYKIIVSRVGAENNPQDIITAVFAIPIVGSWSAWSTMNFSPSAVTDHRFRFQVSFFRSNTDFRASIQRQVVAPPLLPQLDDSVFYPFKRPK